MIWLTRISAIQMKPSQILHTNDYLFLFLPLSFILPFFFLKEFFQPLGNTRICVAWGANCFQIWKPRASNGSPSVEHFLYDRLTTRQIWSDGIPFKKERFWGWIEEEWRGNLHPRQFVGCHRISSNIQVVIFPPVRRLLWSFNGVLIADPWCGASGEARDI